MNHTIVAAGLERGFSIRKMAGALGMGEDEYCEPGCEITGIRGDCDALLEG